MTFISDYLDIIVFAVIAVVVLFRLRSVLGERGADEPQGFQLPNQHQPATGTVSAAVIDGTATRLDDRWTQALPNFDMVDTATVHTHLLQFAAIDPSFRPDAFLDKAKKAYTLIVEAFAKGNRTTLEFLLSPGLYQHFTAQIDAREAQHESYAVQVHGLKKAVISAAVLDGSKARLTVDFTAEQSITHKDAEARLINQQDGRRQTLFDRWVFAKDLKDSAPAWILVDTLDYEE